MHRPITKNDLLKLVDVIQGIADIVRASKHGVPSGELYARVMHVMSLETYQHIIRLLIEAKAIQCKGHLLTAAQAKVNSAEEIRL